MVNALELPKATRSPDTPLTLIQQRFVEHWLRYRNATQAYKFAADKPDLAYNTAVVEGAKLLRDERVQVAVKALAKEAYKDTTVEIGWLLQRYLDIATADPRELIGLKVGCCRFCHGEGHGYQWREHEYLEACAEVDRANAETTAQGRKATLGYPDPAGGFDFNATYPPHPSCPRCHGEGVERFVPRDTDRMSDQALLLYGGVKVKKDGYEIIIADRAKALDMAGKIVGAFQDKVQISGALGAMVAVADLRKVDPVEASKAYRDMVAGHLAPK